jgi:regulator-associated protein of mTOR
LTDRKTPLGELNWIFTAVTDTIAWSVLSRETFQRLFRQDLLVASLFRNYLLAQRGSSYSF